MRSFGICLCLLSCLSSGGVCQGARRLALEARGVKAPGVQIPMSSLKAEAEIVAPGEVNAFLAGDGVYAAIQAGLLPVNVKTNKTEEVIGGVSQPCSTLLNAFGSLWVPSCKDQTVTRIDAKTKKTAATLPLTPLAGRHSMAASPDSIWMLTDEKTTLARVDPEDNKIVAEIRLPAGCNSMLFAEGALWVTCPKEDKVLRIDPNTNLVANRITVEGQPIVSTFGEANVWVLTKAEGKIVRIDPKTNKTTTTVELKTPGIDGDLAFGEGFVWASTPGFPISRIDPATDKVAQQFVGEGGGAIDVGQGSVWLPNLKPNVISRFDPKRIKATLAE